MKSFRLLGALSITIALAAPVFAESNDGVNKAAVGIGVTLGNVVFFPLKAVAAAWGAGMGGLSFILTGGDTELTRQSWQDSTEGPWVITQEFARQSVGTRPEREKE